MAGPRRRRLQKLPVGRPRHALARHGLLDHGDAGKRHHLHLDHGARLHGRHALRAVLLRPAHRHGRHCRRLPAAVSGIRRFHGVRIPRTAVRREDARPGDAALPDPTGFCRRHRDPCPGHRACGHSPPARPHYRHARRRHRHPVHGRGRHQDRRLDAVPANDRHDAGADRRLRYRRHRPSRRHRTRRRPDRRRRRRPPEPDRFRFRLERPATTSGRD